MDYLDKKYFLTAVADSRYKQISDSDIAVRCPICGDSKVHKNEMRLHIYEKNGQTRVGCFNGDCRVGQTNVYRFLRDFYPELFQQYKKEKFNQRLSELSNGLDVFASLDLPKKVQEPKKVITQDLSMYFNELDQATLTYIQSRHYTYKETNFGKWYIGNNPLKIGDRIYYLKDCLIIPLYYKNEMYGFYSRSIKDKKFYTYMNEVNMGYKVWNWFNIDKNHPVYIFEGIFDAISAWSCGLKNVVACMGAKIPDERLKELKYPVFCLDNDKTGLNNMIKYSDKYQVVVWDNQFKDCNEMLINGLNVKDEIVNNAYSGILAQIKIRSKL